MKKTRIHMQKRHMHMKKRRIYLQKRRVCKPYEKKTYTCDTQGKEAYKYENTLICMI